MKWLTVGFETLERTKFQSIKNRRFFNKPHGGLWASPFRDNISPWIKWCRHNSFELNKLNHGVVFKLSSKNIYTIKNEQDLLTLYSIVGEVKGDFGELCDSSWTLLDFEKAATIFDGIYLTHRGQQKTHLTLSGWDCECVLMLNWCAENMTEWIM